MPKFKVTVCYEKWEYSSVEVEAADREAAEAEAERIWNDDVEYERFEAGSVDGNGMIVVDCDEVKEEQLSP